MTHGDEEEELVPPVEPLSDIAWQRVERAVFTQLDAGAADARPADAAPPAAAPPLRPRAWWRRGWLPVTAGLAAAAAAIMIVYLAWPSSREGELAIAPFSGDVAPAPAPSPSRIATGASPSEVVVGDAAITVAAESAVLISGGAEQGVTVILERGEVTCAVAPRHGRPPFIVLAGAVRFEVVGTRFTVARQGDLARIAVVEGTVAVIADGRRTDVHAGESWPTETASASDTPDIEFPDDVVDDAPALLRPRDDHAPTATPIDAKTRYEQAAALEASDPGAALAAYRALARSGGPWAANALFAAGRLSFERDDHTAARELLTRYLRLHPRGANVADARALLARLPASAPTAK